MSILPEYPSTLRKLILGPLAGVYAAGSILHRKLWLRPTLPLPVLPLIVIGSLRAGGAGKTAVTLELARYLRAQGKRVGILTYRMRGPRPWGEIEVTPQSDWRDSSDEAVLLARVSGARVFATRDRETTWRRLGKTGSFDVLLADDGLMDNRLGNTRLSGAFRIALVRPGENPGVVDLLPAGPYRLTVAALKSMDYVLEFSREIVLPDKFDFKKTYWVLSGMGNPTAFRADLQAAGVQVAGLSTGPNHGLPNLPKARREAHMAGTGGVLFTAKDGVKLADRLQPADNGFEIGERVPFSTGFLSAIDVFLAPPSS